MRKKAFTLKKKEATGLLTEISCINGEGSGFDTESLMPFENRGKRFSKSSEPRYKLYVQTLIDTKKDRGNDDVLLERQLISPNEKNFFMSTSPGESAIKIS
jgi:hypothetical protein